MFYGCTSLTSLDISNFDTSKITQEKKLNDMFTNCVNLEFINLKNYKNNGYYLKSNHFQDTVKNIVFCTLNDNLIQELNLDNNECIKNNCEENWYEYKSKIYENDKCTDNCTSTIYQFEYNYKCYPSCLIGTFNNNYKCENCHPDCLKCEKTNTTITSNCQICKSKDKYLYFGNCLEKCPRENAYYYNESINQTICRCELPQCFECTKESLEKKLCIKCEKDYYPIYDELYMINFPLFNCSKSPEGFYLDNSNKENPVYKLCYHTRKKCDTSGNDTFHNCLECKNTYINKTIFGKYKNCYQLCPSHYEKYIENKSEYVYDCNKDNIYKYEFRKKCYSNCPPNSTTRENETNLDYLNIDYNYFCKPKCNNETPFEIISTQHCVKNCDIKSIQDKSCILNYIEPSKSKEESNNKEEEIKINDMILQNLEVSFTESNFNTSDIESGKNDIVEFESMTITLTTTKNQKDDKNNNNMTTIDLGECEDLLRKAYNIPENETIFMKKIDVLQEGMKIPKVEYDVYSKLNGTNLVKLNLSFCSNSKVDLSIPIKITESLDKLNSSSGYYNDICYTTTSDSGTDMSLTDRKKEFVENNKTICQEGCIFSDYDYTIQKAKCSCDVVESSSSFANININKTKLYDNFINIKNIANINLMVCYKVLFSKKGFKKNYGSYSLIPIIVTHIILISLFYGKKYYVALKNKIIDISYGIINWDLVIAERKEKRLERRLQRIRSRNKENKKEKENEVENKIKIQQEKQRIPRPSYIQYIEQVQKNLKNPPIKKIKILHKKLKNDTSQKKGINNNEIIETNNLDSNPNQIIAITNLNNKEILEKTKKIMIYNDEELNNLSYKLAKKYDKRTYWQYYISLLKTKHDLIFTFFNNSDYNLKIIKIDLFLFSFTLYYVVNALFFNDDTMHKIYEDDGSFNLIYQLPQIIYSSLITAGFNILLKLLSLSEGLILQFKKDKQTENLNQRITILDNKIKIKFILYFIVSTVFLLFCWYYLFMFCAIYQNTQVHLIKDTFISFGLSMIYPFGFYLIPGIFRIPSLSNRKNKRKLLYNVSQFLQLI